MNQLAAILYTVLCGAAVVFQVCLIVGAPWGRYTQGGQNPGALPGSGRVIAAISIVLLALMAGSVLSASGSWLDWPRWMSWGAVGMQTVSTILNWITPSRSERLLWAPVTTAMFGLALLALLS